MGHLETAAFEQEILGTVRSMRKLPDVQYEHVEETHFRLFNSLYPWAGQDRLITALDIAIDKAGYATQCAHPADVRRATGYALERGQNKEYVRAHAGEAFGYLAHAHPFLEGNGRTILTIFAELTRRAGFFIEWEAIDKDEFLPTLTEELLHPGRAIMDTLVAPYIQDGTLSEAVTARRLRWNFSHESPDGAARRKAQSPDKSI
jgi:cell filamentation protein